MTPILNLSSEAWCRQAYLNYHCYGNTMGLTGVQMGQICGAWPERVESWQDSVSNDQVEYEFDDSDYDEYIEQGKRDAAENVGHNGKKGGDLARGIGSIGVNGLNAVGTYGVAEKILDKQNIFQGLGKYNQGSANMDNKFDISDKIEENNDKQAWLITCITSAASAGAYYIAKPNKESKEACDKLQGEMTDAQATLTGAQTDMCNYAEEVAELSDEALENNEDTNEEIEDEKADYDFYLKTYEALVAKIEAGEPLDDSEKELYKYCVELLGQIGSNIEDLSEDNTDVVSDLYDDMDSYQAEYDEVAEKMGNIEGLTDFAEGFDKNTKNMCILQSVSHGINTLSAGKAVIDAGKFAASGGVYTAWAWAWVAVGAAAAAGSTMASIEQGRWAGEVSNEIALREGTQEINTQTNEVYLEEVDYYAGMMEGVEDLEMVIPDDVEAPEEGPSPDAPPEDPEDPDDPKKKPMA